MQIIGYLIYCMACAFSVACGNGSAGVSTIDVFLGTVCILILMALFCGIISLIAFIKRRINKKKGIEDKRDYFSKVDFVKNRIKKNKVI